MAVHEKLQITTRISATRVQKQASGKIKAAVLHRDERLPLREPGLSRRLALPHDDAADVCNERLDRLRALCKCGLLTQAVLEQARDEPQLAVDEAAVL